jgi:hypothetical protein
MPNVVEAAPSSQPLSRSPSRLILLSFLMLFLELALIRWTASNVLYLSYFSNFVLLGSFLGIGNRVPPGGAGPVGVRIGAGSVGRLRRIGLRLSRRDPQQFQPATVFLRQW